ncbi:excinuclease ABC subunit B [Entomoplasma freundtii]|uniref:UvrABC system protein B n=1 Tax=Entomoplasma freundtii TaxID=74700 RepID=A0A2K8NVK3_9MOLU|nr:excinuclease ABC subunit UvrB [Entomoplasma freundtii]ATZ16663.1 excinuclease ABC subunit B [Entomoplasma freundtii]TDY58170.1 excinuclease ABC subunit B [Entomoplasma freundtii]
MKIKTNHKYDLVSNYQPSGDQPEAIKSLVAGVKKGEKSQVLMGATGTGKTFTMANVIQQVGKQTLVLAHNKTLAMQLYYELKDFFPNNRVEYFVSNFDYYRPEAYVPSKDLYIDKDSRQNMELDMMRLSAMNALITRQDTIVVASVASIYAIQNPSDYSKAFFELNVGQKLAKRDLLTFLVRTGYLRNDVENAPGTFSVKGDAIKVVPGWTANIMFRISMFDQEIEMIDVIDAVTGAVLDKTRTVTIFPAQGYITPENRLKVACTNIRSELDDRLRHFEKKGLLLEAQRLKQRTNYDLEALEEFGVCGGIENYSSHLEFRKPGERPYTLLDYFQKDYLMIIDESHMTLPQIRGMFNTDRSRKTTLVDYGFRLPSAIDNRPLSYDEFAKLQNQTIYTSATPGPLEMDLVNQQVVQQVIRPTGLLDPEIEIRPSENQIEDLIREINLRKANNERTFVTTLTIRMSEDLTAYLQERGIKVAYLHNELKTLERSEILNELRKGVYDVVVGVNLIREGLDLPEVSLVAVLDADKPGFLRDTRSLIQTAGRAARNANGHVIFYADTMTQAMKEAMAETERRRKIQISYNEKHGIVPKTITKALSDTLLTEKALTNLKRLRKIKGKDDKKKATQKVIDDLRAQMLRAAKDMDFETAATLRDSILELEAEKIS